MPGWNRLINQNQLNLIQNLANEAYEESRNIDHHFHNEEIWIGNNGGSAEIDNLTPFTFISGNNDFGDAVQIFNINDTPFIAGNISFDFHSFIALRLSSATCYYIRIIWGLGTVEQAEAANQYTTFPVIRITTGAVAKGARDPFKFRKIPVGNNVWGKIKNETNEAELDLLFGSHEYPF